MALDLLPETVATLESTKYVAMETEQNIPNSIWLIIA